MPRTLRQDPIDGWHHVTNHAVGHEDLFITDRDRYEFIRRMIEAAERFGVTIAAFCLMGNHFHLVLHCPDKGLSKFMHYLESVYAREFNMRHGRRGALFGSQFYNRMIETEGQLLATIRYVHRNPLELAIDIRAYVWSSYLSYVEGDDTLLRGDPRVLSNVLGSRAEHRRYVETDFGHDELKMSDGVRTFYVSAPTTVERSIYQLCQIASRRCAVTVAEVVAPRAGARNDARQAVTLIAYESRTGFAEELRALLGYRNASSLRSAAKRARDRLTRDPAFAALVTQLRDQWSIADEAHAS